MKFVLIQAMFTLMTSIDAFSQDTTDVTLDITDFKEFAQLRFHRICDTLYNKALEGEIKAYKDISLSVLYPVDSIKHFLKESFWFIRGDNCFNPIDTTVELPLESSYVNLLLLNGPVITFGVPFSPHLSSVGVFYYFDSLKEDNINLPGYPYYGKKKPIKVFYLNITDVKLVLKTNDFQFIMKYYDNSSKFQFTSVKLDSTVSNQYTIHQFKEIKNVLFEAINKGNIKSFDYNGKRIKIREFKDYDWITNYDYTADSTYFYSIKYDSTKNKRSVVRYIYFYNTKYHWPDFDNVGPIYLPLFKIKYYDAINLLSKFNEMYKEEFEEVLAYKQRLKP